MIKFTFHVVQNYEEAGLEGVYDYRLEGSDEVFYSEESAFIKALTDTLGGSDYTLLTLYQLEAECLRNNIYVEFVY